MTQKQTNDCGVSLLGGLWMMTMLPSMIYENTLTSLILTIGGVLFFIGFMYFLFGGRRLFFWMQKKYPCFSELLIAIGWMPYVLVFFTFFISLSMFYQTNASLFSDQMLILFSQIGFVLWLCAGVGSLGWMWYKKRFKK